MSTESMTPEAATDLTVGVIAAYVSHNSMPPGELPGLIRNVFETVFALGQGAPAVPAEPEIQKATASEIKKSITPDAIISFIDGKSYKTMKRHLGTNGLDPHSYRERYGLPSDYPMVAPNYAAQRSALAKSIGLGQVGATARKKAA